MALDQASLALLREWPPAAASPCMNPHPEEVRANGLATAALIGPGPEMVSVRE